MKKKMLAGWTIVIFSLLLAVAAKAELIGGVEFPQGAESFADEVLSFSPGTATEPPHDNPLEALGLPNYASRPPGSDCKILPCNTVALGWGGVLILQFTDNSLTTSGNDALDLWIFEIGLEVESTDVFVSRDGLHWFPVGAVAGATAGIDLDAFIGTGIPGTDIPPISLGDRFGYVKLVDQDKRESLAPYGGADIDAVGAIHSDLPVPIVIPTITIDDIEASEGSGSNTTALFTVTLSEAVPRVVTVDYTTANLSAIAPRDYAATTGTLTFEPGQSSQTISVPVVGDTIDEVDESFRVDLTNPDNATIADSRGIGTIIDNDAPPALSINNVKVMEGDTGTVNAIFTVTLSAVSGMNAKVNYATVNGTATAGSDYTATSGQLKIAAGGLTGTITVPVSGDLDLEADETFKVAFSRPVNATIARKQGTGTITNDDFELSIDDVTVTEGNGGNTNAIFTVTLSAPSPKTVQVAYATTNLSAIAPGDYASTVGTLTFAPGQISQTISVPVVGDASNEVDESFRVDLTNPDNATIADSRGIGTIIDDDVPPGLAIDNVTVKEGNTGTVNATFTVTLSAASGKNTKVDYATVNGTATAGSDYTTTAGTLTIAAGNLTGTITVPVTGDIDFEDDETFAVILSNPVNATIANEQGEGGITNDDIAVFIGDVIVREGNRGKGTVYFTVRLSEPAPSQITVEYATSNGTATQGNKDYTATNGIVSFAKGQVARPVSVSVTGDTSVEGDERFFVNLANATGASIVESQGVCTIINDDM